MTKHNNVDSVALPSSGTYMQCIIVYNLTHGNISLLNRDGEEKVVPVYSGSRPTFPLQLTAEHNINNAWKGVVFAIADGVVYNENGERFISNLRFEVVPLDIFMHEASYVSNPDIDSLLYVSVHGTNNVLHPYSNYGDSFISALPDGTFGVDITIVAPVSRTDVPDKLWVMSSMFAQPLKVSVTRRVMESTELEIIVQSKIPKNTSSDIGVKEYENVVHVRETFSYQSTNDVIQINLPSHEHDILVISTYEQSARKSYMVYKNRILENFLTTNNITEAESQKMNNEIYKLKSDIHEKDKTIYELNRRLDESEKAYSKLHAASKIEMDSKRLDLEQEKMDTERVKIKNSEKISEDNVKKAGYGSSAASSKATGETWKSAVTIGGVAAACIIGTVGILSAVSSSGFLAPLLGSVFTGNTSLFGGLAGMTAGIGSTIAEVGSSVVGSIGSGICSAFGIL